MRLRLSLAALLLAAALPPGGVGAEETSPRGKLQLYVMPDTQSWAWNQGGTTLETWRSVTRALCARRSRFAMVLHTGDLVDNPRLQPVEWTNALSVMRELDACRMPYAIAFGNHDFDNYPAAENVPLEGDRNWRRVMAQLVHQPVETGPSGRSALHPLAPGWFVISTDFSLSGADLDWITGVIAKRPADRFVFLNHSCVNMNGIAFDECRQIFEEHPQIRIAVSGHWLGSTREEWREIPRANGPALLAFYQDYQHVPALAAWGVVIELDPASGAACVWSENLLSGEVGRPAAAAPEVGQVAAGLERRCFVGSDPAARSR